MNIMDLAKAVAPGCSVETIGIRPGEKLHEVLISEDEVRQTLELDDMYVIKPAHPWWKTENYVDARPISDGFRYASNSNAQWLNENDLKQMIDQLESH